MSHVSSIKAFRAAVALLRTIDADLSLYVAGDVLCLMKGPSHDDRSRALRDNVVEYAGGLRIGGGDW